MKQITPEIKARICSRCREPKNIDCFHAYSNGLYCTYCKSCKSILSKDRHRKIRDKNAARLNNEYCEKTGWYNVPDFPLHRISKTGSVIRIDAVQGKVHFLSHTLNRCGYPQVKMTYKYKSKTKRIHRLLAEIFIPNPNAYKEVNHKDGNKLNYKLSNLEWCSRSHNMKHAHQYGLRNGINKRDKKGRISKGNKP